MAVIKNSSRGWLYLAGSFAAVYLALGFFLAAAGKSAVSSWIGTLPLLLAPAFGIGVTRYRRNKGV
jgi:hypothetical protein